jgi:hypothetical protein
MSQASLRTGDDGEDLKRVNHNTKKKPKTIVINTKRTERGDGEDMVDAKG